MDRRSVPVKTYCRQRPLIKQEERQKVVSLVSSIQPREITLKSTFGGKKFSFDHCFSEKCSQDELYQTVVAPYVEDVINGYNCSVIAYGASETGKTYTIFGDVDFKNRSQKLSEEWGFVPRVLHHLFIELSKLNLKTDYTVRMSLIEIFNEEVRDVLDEKTPLRVYDDPLTKGSVCIKGMRQVTICNMEELFDWLNIFFREHHTDSNQAHYILTYYINVRELTGKGEEMLRSGRLQFVDMAACNVKTKEHVREAATINRSLSTFQKVVKALVGKLQHVPVRDSKLTRIIKESLGGSCKASLITTFSPNAALIDETSGILQFAQSAKKITNCPSVNVERKQTSMVKELRDEITKLKEELNVARRGEGFYITRVAYDNLNQELADSDAKLLELTKRLCNLQKHEQVLDMQYRQLSASFDRTKRYLEERQKLLEETQKKREEAEQKLQHLHEEEKVLVEVAQNLLEVCEDSTKSVAIFRAKHEAKSRATAKNVACIKELQKKAVANLETFREVILSTADIREKNLKAVDQKLKSLTNVAVVTFEGVEKQAEEIETYCKEMGDIGLGIDALSNKLKSDLEKFVEGESSKVMDECNRSDDKYKSLIKMMHDVGQRTVFELKKFEAEWNTRYEKREKEVKPMIEAVSKLNEYTVERRKHLEEGEEECNKEIEAIRQKITESEKEEAAIKSRLQDLRKLKQVVDNYSYEVDTTYDRIFGKLAKTGMKAFMKDFISETSTNRIELSSETIETIIEEYLCHLDNVIEARQKEGKNTITQKLEFINEIRTFLKEDLSAKIVELSSEMKQNKMNSQDHRKSLLSVIESADRIVNAKMEEVHKVGHAGDTPVKKSYVVPKVAKIRRLEKENSNPDNSF